MTFMLAVGFVVDHFSYAPVFVAAGLMPLAAAAFVVGGIRYPVKEVT
jgi:hypothetical protein